MKIYGAGSLKDITQCTELGACGILTNPQGFEQYFGGKQTLEGITSDILAATHLPVYIQIHGPGAQAIIDKGLALNALDPGRVGFKIISDEKGFKAIRELQKRGIRCIATCLFSLSQAAVAQMVGAFGVCPFVSRAAAIGLDPYALLADMREMYDRTGDGPEILAVSLKSTADCDLAIRAGVDALGMRYPLLREMMAHPLSEKAETLFGKNWATMPGEDVSYLNHIAGPGGGGMTRMPGSGRGHGPHGHAHV